jgi:predicted RNA-binding protein with TRAM domain
MEEESFGRSGGGFKGPCPVEVGKEYDVEVKELSRRGEGVARVEGFVVFVKGAKIDDRVRVRITRVSRRFAEAEVVGKEDEVAQSGEPF